MRCAITGMGTSWLERTISKEKEDESALRTPEIYAAALLNGGSRFMFKAMNLSLAQHEAIYHEVERDE